jgi:hypothetical protein
VPNVYLPNLVQIRPQYSTEGDDIAENILWVVGSVASGYTNTQLEALQSAFDENWSAVFQDYAATALTYLGSIVTDWTSDEGIQIPLSSVNENGTKSTPVGAQTCVLISWLSPTRYRGGHSRTYLPCVGIESLDGASNVGAGEVTAIREDINNVEIALAGVSAPNGGPYAFRNFRFRNDPEKAEIVIPAGILVQNLLATQRRRLRKASRHR